MYTADEYRAEAERARIDAKAPLTSDNFVTRNAARIMASRYSICAQVIDNGMRDDANALFLHGEFASADEREGQFGTYWVLTDDAAEAFGKRFFTPSKAKDNLDRDRAKGFTYGTINAPATIDERTQLTHPDQRAIRTGDYRTVRIDDYAGRSSILAEVAA